MAKVTARNLFDLAPGAKPEIVDGIVDAQQIIIDAGFFDDDDLRNQFFAQVAHESGHFTITTESLYYTSAARIRQVWPSRFPTLESAQRYVRNEEALANNVYANRLGNGAPASGDGFRFRGSNLLQHTGRDAHRWVTTVTGVDAVSNPDLFRRNVRAGVLAAVRWWQARSNLIAAAKAGRTADATLIINGGRTGLADRIRLVDRAARIQWGREGTVPTTTSNFIRRGDKGAQVLHYQRRLKLHGFYLEGRLDSDFGPGMEIEVREAQRQFGLAPDGVIGPKTAKALDGAPVAVPEPAPAPAPPAAPTPPTAQPQPAPPPRRGWCERTLEKFPF